jgi:tetratricopeptide (TPR) repeat protein
MSETLTPQQLTAEGQTAYQDGRFEDALNLFSQAERAYEAVDDKPMAAEMANNRSVTLLQSGNAQAAFEAADGTDKVFSAIGDAQRQGIAFANQAAALEELKRLPEALLLYEKSADLLKQSGAKEYRAMVLKSISSIQVRTGNQMQAIATMDAALDSQEKLSLRERFLKWLLKVPLRMLKR